MSDHLLSAPLSELCAEAALRRRDTRVTYSPKVFIPLTKLCRDRCGYCTFAQPPARLESPYLSLEEVLKIAAKGAEAGCREALFTLGERPELRYRAAADWLGDRGYDSTLEYLAEAASLVLAKTGLLPHSNAGALSGEEMADLRHVAPSQGMMLESLNPDLECHRGSPDKTPERRLATLWEAGELQIPFTTGILVGIGESPQDRIDALEAIAEAHRAHGHVQEVIVQNFLPKAATAMHSAPPCAPSEHLRAIVAARLVLPDDVAVQAPPNLSEDVSELLRAGVEDFGGVSPVTLDHVNPERPWPHLSQLAEVTRREGFSLVPRLTLHPRFVLEPHRWLHPDLHFPVCDLSDAEGFARESDGGWYAGHPAEPPVLLIADAAVEPPPCRGARAARPELRRRGMVAGVLEGVMDGCEVGEEEITALFSARGEELQWVAEVADELRRKAVGDVVTWVSNRNINYTNVCTFKCRFCGFSKGPLSLNLRGDPYLLTLDDIAERTSEAARMGATEVCLQGGIHPNFDGNYYVDVARAVSDAAGDIHIHGFTALEVTEGARRLGEPLRDYLLRLMDAGLRSLPGTAAEILDDEVRSVLCPDKISTEEWLEAHRTAHGVGLRSNVTIMFGSVERPVHWARHIIRTRDLQRETGGFTEFVPLPFVHMAAPIYLRRGSRRGPTFREALLMHAVGRIAYHGYIDNVQASWVKLGFAGVRQALKCGVNDLGGTLINENISRAAGADHGQSASREDFLALTEPLGRVLEQRTTLYGRRDAALSSAGLAASPQGVNSP